MKKVLLISLVLVLGLAANGWADLVLPLDFNFSAPAAPPAGPSPWLVATFEDIAGGVKLTMDFSGLSESEKVGVWYFNFDPVEDLASSDVTWVSGPVAALTIDEDKLKADGDGKYDFMFDWAGFVFDNTEVVYNIAGFTAEDFNFLSVPCGGHGPFLSAAHVQSIGTGSTSAWIGADNTGDDGGDEQEVPEPSTLLLIGIGLLGLGLLRKR